jgi:hypothetical protein
MVRLGRAVEQAATTVGTPRNDPELEPRDLEDSA